MQNELCGQARSQLSDNKKFTSDPQGSAATEKKVRVIVALSHSLAFCHSPLTREIRKKSSHSIFWVT